MRPNDKIPNRLRPRERGFQSCPVSMKTEEYQALLEKRREEKKYRKDHLAWSIERWVGHFFRLHVRSENYRDEAGKFRWRSHTRIVSILPRQVIGSINENMIQLIKEKTQHD